MYAYQLVIGVGDDVVAYAEDGVFVPVDTGGGFCDVEFALVFLASATMLSAVIWVAVKGRRLGVTLMMLPRSG